MAENAPEIDLQEQLSRLSRAEGSGLKNERKLVTAIGAAPAAWTIKVVSNAEYNYYNVRQVSIVNLGSEPLTISSTDTQAFNLGESFTSAGSVPDGTYAVMWRAGDKNVFYVKT